MAVKVHETGYGKWKVPVIIIAVIVVLGLAGTGILLSDSLGVSIEEGSKRIEVAEGDGTSSVAKLLKDNGIIKYPLLLRCSQSSADMTVIFSRARQRLRME